MSLIKKKYILLIQLFILILFILLWELLANNNIINSFIFSSPSKILNTFNTLLNNNLFNHIMVTLKELFISFLYTNIFGFIIASLLWYYPIINKILDPYITILNSLPKVALGPLIIIWFGANTNSIIIMSLLISIFITIINIYNGFISTNKSYISLLKSFNATKIQIFYKLIIPANIVTIINTLKINISMCLIGVIMGELLVSKSGIGYLILYGSQIFNISLIITGIIIIAIIAYIMYLIINYLENKTVRKF